MSGAYLWIQSAHVVAMTAWMAGMLYLPRLYVYHAGVAAGSEASETFKVMEARLLRLIMNPAMIVTILLGAWLAYDGGWLRAGWLHGKITLVLLMAGVHGVLAKRRREFAEDRNTRSARYYRVLNEVPTLLLIGIVVLVVVKPSFR